MASRAHLQDNSVVERRLRPIYDWLDSGNNKKALQECDKVLKKTPNLLCAKALKALSLLRIGKESDCITLLNGVVAEKPADEATLQAITLCYRELQQLDKICNLYQAAVQIDPNNEELHTHLFMSYVRISDFRMQQQTALNLYKLKPKNPYYCWAVMSVVLQATRGPGKQDSEKRKLLLSLAERMINKLKSEDKMEAEQEVQLLLMILELDNKFEEALKIVDGPLGTKLLSSSDVITYKLPYLVKMEKWKHVNLLCKNILMENMDRWDVWKEYINSVIRLIKLKDEVNYPSGNNYENEEENCDDSPEKAHEFICSVIENGYLLRGPYLSRFELCSQLSKIDLKTLDLLGDSTQLFLEYFHKFGHKSCCVPDLKIYLHLLNPEQKSQIAVKIVQGSEISSDTSVALSEEQMQRHIGSLQLSRLCGGHEKLSVEHLQALVATLSLHYQKGHEKFGKNLLPTDVGPSDAYGILASHVLYDMAQSQESSKPLVAALVLLENLLTNSPSNFNAKLLCVKFYHLLGCGLGAQHWYDSLDVKHLQLDSLGHIHCSRLYPNGLYKSAETLYDTTLKFFTSNYKDSCDHLTFSYKFGSFIKLEEFMNFRERLKNSLHYVTTSVDRIILSLVHCSSIESLNGADFVPADENIEWDVLRDNRDLSIYSSWNPKERNTSEVKVFEQDLAYLKLRFSLLRCFSIALDVMKSSDGVRQKHCDRMEAQIREWRHVLDQKFEPVTTQESDVSEPPVSLLHAYLKCPSLCGLFDLFHAVATDNERRDGPRLASEICSTLETHTERVVESVKALREISDCLWDLARVLEQVVYIVEVLSIVTLVCVFLQSCTRKSKKKMDWLAFKDVASCTKVLMMKIEKSLDEWKIFNGFNDLRPNFGNDLSEKLACLDIERHINDSVQKKLENSHQTSVKEIKNVVRSKIKFMNNFFNS